MKKACLTAACCLAMFACADKQPAQDPTYVTTTSTTEEARTATAQKPVTPTQSQPVMDTPSTAPPQQAQLPSPIPSDPGKADPALAQEDPSNTAINKRDRQDGVKTPMNQGNTKSDTDITAAIRRSVVADGALSFSGKNVKIITKDGHVTLRGPVKTDAEKSSIESKAKSADGVKDVDNQLEIKK